MRTATRTTRRLFGAVLVPLGLLLGSVSSASASDAGQSSHARFAHVFTVHVILAGSTLMHSFTPAGSSVSTTDELSYPDDITKLGDDIFVGFQNGVGPQGGASTNGNLDSTVVELRTNGDPVAQWDIAGKADGLTADPESGIVIATVNEDGNSSLFTIDPGAPSDNQVTHFSFGAPLAHNGGTDAISIYRGRILISASAPGTTGPSAPQSTYPAVYTVLLDPSTHLASVTPLFDDEDQATVANLGAPRFDQSVPLALTDPDSNEVVPSGARFGGDFMLTSQGDQQQIFVHDPGARNQSLAVLSLSQAVDDTAWLTNRLGTLYSTDSTDDTIDTVTGPFEPNEPLVVATPCGANTAPATCPAPPAYPANYLGTLNPFTGLVTAVTTEGAAFTPQGGLLFIAQGGRSHRFGHRSGSRRR